MYNDLSFSDEMDHEILMHRNTHFSCSFSAMLEYYQKEGKGAQPEFEHGRIRQLQHIEEHNPLYFIDFLLPDELSKVERACSLYRKFQSLYEDPKATTLGLMIADLVLSEEVDPIQEIDRIVALGSQATPALIALLQSEDFYDPLFPGYGYGPAYAAVALGKIGDPRAIGPLFQAMGHHDYFLETTIVDSLNAIGAEAKEFLLKRLTSLPISEENTRAAIALISFRDDEQVAKEALTLLEKTAFDLKHLILSTYLTLCLSGIKLPAELNRVQALIENKSIPEKLRSELCTHCEQQ